MTLADRLRAKLLRGLLSTPARGLLVTRERRLALVASLSVCVAFSLAVFAPAWLLLMSPLLLGVPHIAADVRHLVLRRALPRGFTWAVVAGCLALIAVRGGESLVAGSLLGGRLELGLAAAWVAAAWWLGGLSGRSIPQGNSSGGALEPNETRERLVRPATPEQAEAAAPGRAWARLGGACLVAAGSVALVWPTEARLFFAHAHNWVALALWLYLFRSQRRFALIPLALALVGTLCLQLLFVQRLSLSHGVSQLWGFSVTETAHWLAPFGASRFSLGLTLAYAALQAVHYTVWLYCIPQEDMRAQGSQTFRMSAAGLLKDFGGLGLALVVAASLAVLIGATVNPGGARGIYLSLAGFHAYLELAVWVYLVRRGGLDAPEPRRFRAQEARADIGSLR